MRNSAMHLIDIPGEGWALTKNHRAEKHFMTQTVELKAASESVSVWQNK